MREEICQQSIWDFIDSLEMNIRLDERAGRADRVFYQHLQEGLRNHDLDKIYECVDATERGRGLIPDSKVGNVVEKAFDADPKRLCRIIAKRKNVVDYWIFFFTCCTIEMIEYFVRQEVEEILFYYECARFLMERSHVGCEEGIVIAVKQIAKGDIILWERWIRKNEHNMKWQGLLDRIMGDLSERALVSYAQQISLDRLAQVEELRIITQAFQNIPETQKEYVFGNISEVVMMRWETMINEKKKGKVFQNKIIISCYANVIIDVLQYMIKDESMWIKYLVKWEIILERDMYSWYESETVMLSIFFYDLTYIYYILLIGEQIVGRTENEEVQHCFYNIATIIHNYERFWKDDVDGRKEKIYNILKLGY